MSKRLVDYAFNILKLDELFGLTEQDNFASRRVIEKLGMRFVEQRDHNGISMLFHVRKFK